MTGQYDCDRLYAVPWPLRLRTIHAAMLIGALLSLATALQWPGAWRVIAVGDLALASIFLGLAASREWFLHATSFRYRVARRIPAPSGY
ncbi:MAG: hypothetical protein ACREHD_15100 [Pirellulales bacterium]